jgi:hypothetical protein
MSTYYPKRNQIVDLVRKAPESILYDQDGRIYGSMHDSPLVDQIADFDGDNMLLAWVFLPKRKKGQFVTRDVEAVIETGDDLQLPEIEEELDLYHYITRNLVGRVKVLYFTEKQTRDGRSCSVLLYRISVNKEDRV